jgi:GNAT superfamily N-acetyltransferase
LNYEEMCCDEYHYSIGKKLMEAMESWNSLKGLNGILGTRDAHGLYEQYGFTRHEMMRKPASL